MANDEILEQNRQDIERVNLIATRRRVPARRRSPYGKKGGTSANAGRKATTYRFTYPDGTEGSKKSFQVSKERAYIGMYEHEGKWYPAGIYEGHERIPASQVVGQAYRVQR